MPVFHYNTLYKEVFTTDAYEIDICGGRGRGGSHFCTDYFLFLITQPNYFRGYFMRLIHGDIRESLYRDFRDRIDENETLNEDDFIFNDSRMSITYIPTGNQIHSKGFRKSSSSRTAKMKSIAGATHVIIEEFEEIPEDDYMQLDDSLRTTKAEKIQILRIWNPPQKDHWIIKKYYDLIPATVESDESDYYYFTPKKTNTDHLCIYGTYKDNAKNINEKKRKKWENYKITNPDHYYTDIKGLVSSGVKGQIYKGWKLYKELPSDNYYRVLGLDFGFESDPMALIELFIFKDRKEVYCRELIYETHLRISELIKKIKELNPNNDEVICDNSNPSDITEMQIAGIMAMKTIKNVANSTKYQDIYQLKTNYHFYYHEESKNLQHEGNEYKWAIDPATKEPLKKPVDKEDHLMDGKLYALRYWHRLYGIM